MRRLCDRSTSRLQYDEEADGRSKAHRYDICVVESRGVRHQAMREHIVLQKIRHCPFNKPQWNVLPEPFVLHVGQVNSPATAAFVREDGDQSILGDVDPPLS